jgi:N-acetylmuramic acid 6-phosphate etherase
LSLPLTAQISPTERRNPRSLRLDKMSVESAIRLMLSEEQTVPGKLLRQRATIARIINAIARAFRRGGRLFYVGAGTSGRLGVLDASECPPTFQTPPEQVQAIIAGGDAALRKAVEAAEDDCEAGSRAIAEHRVNSRDVVIGITASGTAPFVWGALGEGKRRRAATVLICFNPYLRIPAKLKPSILLAVDLGAEILTGSTRLKAGTATKLLLNMFTTLAMVRSGKVLGNLMIDLKPTNAKLRARAVRIVQELTRATASEAEHALAPANWIIRRAVARLSRKSRDRA